MSYLHGIGLKNYRGIGQQFQFASPLTKFNFFIGHNNAGKSAFLEFAAQCLSEFQLSNPVRSKGVKFADLDRNISGGQIEFAIGLPVEEAWKTISQSQTFQPNAVSTHGPVLLPLLKGVAQDNTLWLKTIEPFQTFEILPFREPIEFSDLHVHPSHWRALVAGFSGRAEGDSPADWIDGALRWVAKILNPTFPPASLIPAKRVVGPTGEDFVDFSGSGLIDRLAQLQNPDVGKRQEKQDFDKINAFIEAVLEKPGAKIEIPYGQRHILVHMDNKVLPLSSLGTGIHEIVLIAAFCTISKEQIVCIEEPENHLHPRLQRKLIEYLRDNTDNQYFIASHSSAFMDMVECSIFRVGFVDGSTKVMRALSPKDKHELCFDLGYKPTDILHANCLIWVEGPSDRIYLNYWISKLNQELREGIDYTIMFYGGKLLSNLSLEDSNVEDFVPLLSINRRVVIVIDSDLGSPRQTLRDTKVRIVEETEKAGGISWVTYGREIENYIPFDTREKSVKSAHKSAIQLSGAKSRFGKPLNYMDQKGKEITRGFNKARIARAAVSDGFELSEMDLLEQMQRLVDYILESGE